MGLAFLGAWFAAYTVWKVQRQKVIVLEERLRPKLRLAYAAHKMTWQDGYKHTFLQAINDSETVISGVQPKIIDLKFKKLGSGAWKSTTILSNFNMSWCDVADVFPHIKYFAGDLPPEGEELIDFVKGPHRHPEQNLAYFTVRIDPHHTSVDTKFHERGLYKFVMQISAPNAGKADRLTLYVDWDGADFAILSDDLKTVEPIGDNRKEE